MKMTREELIDLIVMSIDDLPINKIDNVFTMAMVTRKCYAGPLMERADRTVMSVTRQEQEILTAYRTIKPKYKPVIYKAMLDNQASQEERHNKLIYHDGVISLPEYRRRGSGGGGSSET